MGERGGGLHGGERGRATGGREWGINMVERGWDKLASEIEAQMANSQTAACMTDREFNTQEIKPTSPV